MMQAVTKIIAINAQIPATTEFGVQPYSMLDQITPRKTVAWMNFKRNSNAV